MEKFSEEEPQKNLKNSTEEDDISINEKIRIGFIRKVYGILTFQLLLTFSICLLTFFPIVIEFMIKNLIIFKVSIIIQCIIGFILLCNDFISTKNLFRYFPFNYILLLLFTLALGYEAAFICLHFNKKIVLTAIFLTLGITIILTICTLLINKSNSLFFSFLYSFVAVIIETLIFFFLFNYELNLTFKIFLELSIYFVYLIFETGMILNEFGYGYEIDDYIFATLNIYIEVFRIFIKILLLIFKG